MFGRDILYQSINISDLFDELDPEVNDIDDTDEYTNYTISKDKFAFIVFDTQQILYSDYSDNGRDEHLKIIIIDAEAIEELLESRRRNDELEFSPIVSITEDNDNNIKLVVRTDKARVFKLKDDCYQYFQKGTITNWTPYGYFRIFIEYINDKLVYNELIFDDIDIWNNFEDYEIDYIPIEFKDGKFSFQFGIMRVGREKGLALVEEEWIVKRSDRIH